MIQLDQNGYMCKFWSGSRPKPEGQCMVTYKGPKSEIAEITSLYIGRNEDGFDDESLRNKGYGQQMLKELFEELKAKGCQSVELGVYKNNGRARHVYEKLGFRVKNDWPAYFWMEKQLVA